MTDNERNIQQIKNS